jgi:predicted nucleotidyltransferase
MNCPLQEDRANTAQSVIPKTVALGDLVRARLEGAGGKVRLAFVFGSVASGSEGPASDIDMLLVGSIGSRELSAILGPLGREVGLEFNPVLYSEEEIRRKAKSGNHFMREVILGRSSGFWGARMSLRKWLQGLQSMCRSLPQGGCSGPL